MSIQRIDIRIEDNWKYGEVAFLVDRDDFLQDIKRGREELGIVALIPGDQVSSWLDGLINQEVHQETKINKIILKFLNKYHRARPYYLVIQYALLSGVVMDEDFPRTVYCDIIYPEDVIDQYTSGVFKEPLLAIILTPEAKLDDVVRSFQTEFPEVTKAYKKYLDIKRISPDTISNIKRDREWYWQRINGESLRDIAIADNKGKEYFKKAQEAVKHIKNLPDKESKEYLSHLKFIDNYAEKVRKAVDQYERWLNSEL